MLYALLLPGEYWYPDLPIAQMPGTKPRPGKDLLATAVLTKSGVGEAQAHGDAHGHGHTDTVTDS